MEAAWLAVPGLVLWVGVLILPWQPWRVREVLDGDGNRAADLADITALVPARNEAGVIAETLLALAAQGKNLRIVLINDQSTDDTATVAAKTAIDTLEIIEGRPLEIDWTGKLWALQQGLASARTELLLLIDADIRLQAGLVSALRSKLREDNLDLASLMASLRMRSPWEKLLLPAFVYFFKLLYPFRLSNSGSSRVAAAAGGCILLRREALARAGGFAAIKDRLIDDCALARQFKDTGLRTWIGLSRSVLSQRRYDDLAGIWNMVARTAFTQLRYSTALLALCSVLLLAAFLLPVASLFALDGNGRLLGATALLSMAASYLPTLRYYALNPLWTLALPLTGTLYLLMTWSSARRYWGGMAADWKNRRYAAS